MLWLYVSLGIANITLYPLIKIILGEQIVNYCESTTVVLFSRDPQHSLEPAAVKEMQKNIPSKGLSPLVGTGMPSSASLSTGLRFLGEQSWIRYIVMLFEKYKKGKYV